MRKVLSYQDIIPYSFEYLMVLLSGFGPELLQEAHQSCWRGEGECIQMEISDRWGDKADEIGFYT